MQTIIACKRCAAILGEKFYKLYELAPVNEPCSVCRKTENVKRYEFERRGRKNRTVCRRGITVPECEMIRITDDRFADMRDSIDAMIRATLDEMTTKYVNDGSVTLKVNIELLPSSAPDYDNNGNYLAEREAKIPKITFKVSNAVTYPKGKIAGEVFDANQELLPDGKGGYTIVDKPERQMSLL